MSYDIADEYRLIAEKSSDLIAISSLDSDATLIYVSPSYERVLGFKPKELIGTKGLDLLHPNDQSFMSYLLKKYLVNSKNREIKPEDDMILNLEYRLRTSNGNYLTMSATIDIVDEKLIYIQKDITENKIAQVKLNKSYEKLQNSIEEIRVINKELEVKNQKLIESSLKLENSEDKYHSLFNNMMNGFAFHSIIIDEMGNPCDYVFLEVNEAFERMTGLKSEDIRGKTVTEVLPGIEDDPADWIGTYGKVALEGGQARFEQYSKDIDRWFSVYVYCPRKGFFATIFEDITANKKAEEEIEINVKFTNDIIQSMPGLFYVIEKESLSFIRKNDNWKTITGYSNTELEVLKAYDFFEEGPDRVKCTSKILEAFEQGYTTMENNLFTKEGEKIPYFFTGQRITLHGREYLAGLGIDISDRKKAEIELKNYSERLELMVEDRTKALKIEKDKVELLLTQKTEFLNQISHDLRTPLVPLTTLLPLVRKDIGDGKFRDWLDITIRNVGYMNKLIDETLKLSRLDSGMFSLQKNQTSLKVIIAHILDSHYTYTLEKNIEIIDNIPENLMVFADELRLIEVIDNLFSNSIRFVDIGGRIIFDAFIREDHVEISVNDNGRGIEGENLERIFVEFFQTDESRGDSSSGLGLAISKRIIEAHNGKIWAESEGLGKGSTFKIILPFEEA